jgi:hypothetical protein
MLPWSFSEEAAAEKYTPQLPRRTETESEITFSRRHVWV